MAKEWFKARTIWGAAIETLSDAEAGRLMKAVWEYEATGHRQDLNGAEKGIYALILMTLCLDAEKDADISEKRAKAGSEGGKQKVANANFAKQNVANEANALIRIKNKEEDIQKETLLTEGKEKVRRFIPPTADEVAAYCRERNNGVDAQTFVDFYSSKGWKVGSTPMKDWKACVRTWEKRNTGATKRVIAQDFEQRDYAEIDKQITESNNRHIIESLCKENGLWDEFNNKPISGWREKLDAMKGQQDFPKRDYSEVQDRIMSDLASEMEDFKLRGGP